MQKEPLRILVVDDNKDAADSLAKFFSMGGHEVHTAYNGKSAVAAVKERLPHVILLDIGMRDMNGFMVAKTVRTMELLLQPKIITISGYPLADIEKRADLNISRHFVKPADLTELVACVTRRDA